MSSARASPPLEGGWWIDCPACDGKGRVLARTSRRCTRCTNGRLWLADPCGENGAPADASAERAAHPRTNVLPRDELNLPTPKEAL